MRPAFGGESRQLALWLSPPAPALVVGLGEGADDRWSRDRGEEGPLLIYAPFGLNSMMSTRAQPEMRDTEKRDMSRVTVRYYR